LEKQRDKTGRFQKRAQLCDFMVWGLIRRVIRSRMIGSHVPLHELSKDFNARFEDLR